MHKAIGTAIAAVGVAIAVLGLAIMAILGPDGRFRTGPHAVDTNGVAIVTAPGVISWKNLDIELLAEVPAHKPIFVGVGNSVDVEAYLKGVQRLEVTDFETPWKVRTRQVAGRDALGGAPTAVDWWRAHSAGLGGAVIKTKLPDETVSAVILTVGSSNLRGLKVTFAYGLEGGFLKGLGLLLGGLGMGWAGILVRRGVTIWADDGKLAELPTWAGDESPTQILPALGGRKRSKPKPAESIDDASTDDVEHEVVYVYVDEDGVEHQLTEAEAAEYEVLSEHVEERGADDDEADVDDEADDDHGADRPGKPVTYFWVDDDGIEHEVSADELHKYELLEGDDPAGGPS
jgi:hypothetical protein